MTELLNYLTPKVFGFIIMGIAFLLMFGDTAWDYFFGKDERIEKLRKKYRK